APMNSARRSCGSRKTWACPSRVPARYGEGCQPAKIDGVTRSIRDGRDLGLHSAQELEEAWLTIAAGGGAFAWRAMILGKLEERRLCPNGLAARLELLPAELA